MVAHTFDDGDGAGVPDRETLARNAAEIAFAGDGAIKNRVADDDRFLRHEAHIGLRLDDELAAGQALADIVIGLAGEIERHAMAAQAPKLWPATPLNVTRMVSSGRPAWP